MSFSRRRSLQHHFLYFAHYLPCSVIEIDSYMSGLSRRTRVPFPENHNKIPVLTSLQGLSTSFEKRGEVRFPIRKMKFNLGTMPSGIKLLTPLCCFQQALFLTLHGSVVRASVVHNENPIILLFLSIEQKKKVSENTYTIILL